MARARETAVVFTVAGSTAFPGARENLPSVFSGLLLVARRARVNLLKAAAGPRATSSLVGARLRDASGQ